MVYQPPGATLSYTKETSTEGTDLTTLPITVRGGMTPRLPPVVPGSFLLGSALDLRRDMLAAYERAFHEHGDVVRFLVGPPGRRLELFLLFHPDAAQHVLASSWTDYRKDNVFYREVRGAFGDGLLTSQDDQWQRQKRFLQPLFTARRVAGYASAMGEQVEKLARRWRQRPSPMVDLHDEMTRLTLRIVCRVLFGEDFRQALPVVQGAFGPLGEAVLRRAMSPLRLPVGWPTPVNRRLVRARQGLYGVCDEIIARRRAGSSSDRDRREDLVGLLLDARDDGSSLSDSEIRDQVLIFLLDVQRRVREEVTTVVGNRTPAAQDAPALVYTTMVLKEAMRLYPAAPLLGRLAVADDEVSGYRIPAGSNVIVAPWVIHRHPELWDEPERFDPERFTPEREKARHRYAWFPFGGGPRGCIGQHFSMLESVIALAALVRDFELSAPAGEPLYTNHITLRPTHGVPSLVTPRSASGDQR